MSAKQIQQIYQYIQSNGNFLSSEKVLKQVDKHPEIIWELIVRLCSKLKNRNIESAYIQMIYTLSQAEKHQRSSKWLKQYMDIRDLALKLGTTYTVMDYIKPQREKIINLIGKIIQVAKGVNKLKGDFDQLIVKDDMMSKQASKYKALEQTTRIALDELIQRKKGEKPIFDEKVQTCDRINQQIYQKRQQKLDFISKQKYLKQEISKHQKSLEDIRYENENKLIRIQQLKKQVAQNAPQVKKQKRAVQDEYHKFQKQAHAQLQLARHRQSKIITGLQGRKKYKNLIIDQVNKLIDVFSVLDQSKLKCSKLKQDNQQFRRKRNDLYITETDIKDKVHALGMELYNQGMILQNLNRLKQKLQSKYRQLIANVTISKDMIRACKERNLMFNKIIDQNKQKIEEIKRNYEKKLQAFQNDSDKWNDNIMNNVESVFQPLFKIYDAPESYSQ